MDKQQIALIEDLPLRPIYIWYTFLVALGKKQSAWFSVSSNIFRTGQTPKHIDQSITNDIKNAFEAIGIKYAMRTSISSAGILQPDDGLERLTETCDIFIAKDDEILKNLVKAVDDKNDEQIGTYLGFPETAVSAFKDKNVIKKSELPPEIRFSEVASFTQFMLSKDNWQDELNIVQDWINTLKSISEITYLGCRSELRVLDDGTRKIMIEHYDKM